MLLGRSGLFICRGLSSAASVAAKPSTSVHPASSSQQPELLEFPRTNTHPGLPLFPDPCVQVPSFEPGRRIGNALSQSIYRLVFEKAYSQEGFLNGAEKAIVSAAECVAEGRWDALQRFASKDLVERLREERGRLGPDAIESLRFTQDNIVHSFIFSSLFAGRNVFKLSESGNMFIVITAVAYIRKPGVQLPPGLTVSKLLRQHGNDIFYANISLSRQLNPLGVWKATVLNYFL